MLFIGNAAMNIMGVNGQISVRSEMYASARALPASWHAPAVSCRATKTEARTQKTPTESVQGWSALPLNSLNTFPEPLLVKAARGEAVERAPCW